MSVAALSTGLESLYLVLPLPTGVGAAGKGQLFSHLNSGFGNCSVLATALAATGLGEVIIGLLLAVAGALIAAALLAALKPLAQQRQWKLPKFDSSYLSISNLVWLTVWLGLYDIKITRDFLGDSIGIPSRNALGTLIVVHYLLGAVDRHRRGLDLYSQTAPAAAAATVVIFTVSQGSIWGTGPAAFAALLFLIGYFQSDAYGRHTFGVAMFLSALAGDFAIALGSTDPGEFLLVLAGIIAGARSITAFLKKIEDRRPPSPSTAAAVPNPS